MHVLSKDPRILTFSSLKFFCDNWSVFKYPITSYVEVHVRRIPSKLETIPSSKLSTHFAFPLEEQDQRGCHLKSIRIDFSISSLLENVGRIQTIFSMRRCSSGDNLSHCPDSLIFFSAATLELNTSRRIEHSTPKSRTRDSASLDESRNSLEGDTF